MNRIAWGFLVLCPLSFFSIVFPQERVDAQATSAKTERLPTAAEISERYAKASGGREAWAKLSTLVLTGTIEVASPQMSGTVEILAKAPNKLLLTMSLLNGQFVRKQGYDGQNGWEFDPESGLKRLAGAELQQTKLDAVFDTDIRFAELYPDMKVVGKTSVGNREAYKVSTKGPDGKNKNFYFDAQTWLRIAEDAETTDDNGKNLELKSFFEDYRAVAGVQLPFRVRITSSSISFVMNIQEAKHNVPVEDSSFAVPAESAAAPKPAADTAADTPDEGETKGHTYENKFFGMQYDFPEDWTIHGEETKKRIMEVGKNAVSGDDPARRPEWNPP